MSFRAHDEAGEGVVVTIGVGRRTASRLDQVIPTRNIAVKLGLVVGGSRFDRKSKGHREPMALRKASSWIIGKSSSESFTPGLVIVSETWLSLRGTNINKEFDFSGVWRIALILVRV